MVKKINKYELFYKTYYDKLQIQRLLFISPFCVFSLIVGSFENIVGSFEK